MKIEELRVDKIEIPSWSIKYELEPVFKEKLKLLIKKFGCGLICVRNSEKGYEVVDGRKRIQCVRELQIKNVLCANYENLSDLYSIVLARVLNHQWSTVDFIALSELLNVVSDKKDISSIANYFPETRNEVEYLFRLLEFDWSQFDKEQTKGFFEL